MSVDEDDEAVYCFGRNSRGQLGLGHKNAISPSLPVRIPSLSSLPVRVTAVFCGYDHAFEPPARRYPDFDAPTLRICCAAQVGAYL